MSEQQNLEAFRRIIEEAFNREEYSVLNELVAPDFLEHQFGLHAGIDGLTGDIRYLHQAFPDFHLTIEDLAAADGKVWARMTARGTNTGGFMGPANGKMFAAAVFDLARFHDGRMVEHWGSPDRFAIMAQLDLLPNNRGGSS
jgi:predicted ester cyclase